MSSVIQFLESMGSNAVMARMSAADYAAAVGNLETSEEDRRVLLARDSKQLGELLDARIKMYCVIFAPDEQPSPERETEDSPSTPDQEDKSLE
jgi:hypothetical protein